MATFAQWVSGARPRTLPAAIAPVAAGTGAAAAVERADAVSALLALLVALALQVGVNYANDYSDGVRGTDTDRVGPLRLVGSGVATPAAVRSAALLSFLVAAVAGVALVARSGEYWLIAVGAACVAAAWYYTGGKQPYGYRGLGEVSVFVCFGLVAVVGTTYVQADRITIASILAGIGCGALACAILVVNNLRDVPTDRVAGKTTLAVRIGESRTRVLYLTLVAAAALVVLPLAAFTPEALAALLAFPLAARPVSIVRNDATGRALIPVLAGTGRLLLAYGLLLGLGLALG